MNSPEPSSRPSEKYFAFCRQPWGLLEDLRWGGLLEKHNLALRAAMRIVSYLKAQLTVHSANAIDLPAYSQEVREEYTTVPPVASHLQRLDLWSESS